MQIIKTRILNTAKFSLPVIKGNEAQRLKIAENLTLKFFKDFKNIQIKHSNKKTKHMIENLLKQYHINLNVRINKDENLLGSAKEVMYISKQKPNITEIQYSGYEIYIPNKNDKNRNYTIMHEVGHVFDAATNPKFIKDRTFNLKQDKNFDKQASDKLEEITSCFIDENIEFGKKHSFRKDILKQIKNLPNDYIINYIQDLRAVLKSEIHQYELGLKLILLDKNTSLKEKFQEIKIYSKLSYRFKLNLLNKLLKQKIDTARKNNRETISQKNLVEN